MDPGREPAERGPGIGQYGGPQIRKGTPPWMAGYHGDGFRRRGRPPEELEHNPLLEVGVVEAGRYHAGVTLLQEMLDNLSRRTVRERDLVADRSRGKPLDDRPLRGVLLVVGNPRQGADGCKVECSLCHRTR